MPRSHEDHRQRRRFLKRKVLRNTPHVAARAIVWVASPNTARPKTRSPGCDVGHTRTDRPNDAANFIAEDARVGRIAGIKRERLEHVAEIHPRRLHVDQDLARSARRQRERRKTQRIEVTALAGFESQRQSRIEPLLARRPAAIESLDVARFAAQGDLAFRVFAQQLAPEQRRIRGRAFERQIDSAAGKIRILVQNHAHQSDGRRLRDRDRLQLAAHRLRAASDEIDAKLGRGPVAFERLREMEQRVSAHSVRRRPSGRRDSTDRRFAPVGVSAQL